MALAAFPHGKVGSGHFDSPLGRFTATLNPCLRFPLQPVEESTGDDDSASRYPHQSVRRPGGTTDTGATATASAHSTALAEKRAYTATRVPRRY